MYELRVLNGLHQGAALPLIGDQWDIGSDAEQDLALYDPGVAGLHCRLQRVDDQWQLNAMDGVICNEQGHGQAVIHLTTNLKFTLSTVWLCLAHAQDAWVDCPTILPQNEDPTRLPGSTSHLEKATLRSRVFNRVSGVVLGLLIGVVGSAWSLTRPATSVAPQPVASEKPLVKAPLDSVPGPGRIEDARRHLITMLKERLLDQVSLHQTPEGLTLTGHLDDESLQVYRRMLGQFKDHYPSPISLVDNVSTSSTGLPFVIVQIMAGPLAHLVIADGQRLYIGDERQGLRLTRIDDHRIRFEGDRHYEVHW
jgi:type III secretion protein D